MLQEKILPFLSVSEAVKLPEESSPMDEIEAELARLRVEQAGGDARLDAGAREQHGAGAEGVEQGSADRGGKEAGLQRGPNDAAVQVPSLHTYLSLSLIYTGSF